MNKNMLMGVLVGFSVTIQSYAQPFPVPTGNVNFLPYLPGVWVFSNGTPVNGITTFTNPQVAINTLLATNSSTILVTNTDGTAIIYPPVGGTIHLGNGEWFSQNGFDLTSSNSSQLRITGNGINSRLVGASRVINDFGTGRGMNFNLEIDHIAICATNSQTNDVLVYLPNPQQLEFHENFITRYNNFFQTNSSIGGTGSYLSWDERNFTNATGLVGLYDAAGLNKQRIFKNVFAGLSHGIIAVGDHIEIEDNDFNAISQYGVSEVVNSNLWTWTSTMFGNGNIVAAELTEGACIMLSDKGGITVQDNHFFQSPYSIYRNKLSSSLYGKPNITRNLGESTLTDIFIDTSNRVPSNLSFYNNFSGAGSVFGSVIGWADFSKLANITNIVLTGWTPTFINGTYKLNSNASTFGGNFLSYMTWTNVLNTNNFITLNDPTTVGGFEIQDSTNYTGSATPDFSANTTQTYPILNPVYTTTWTPFFAGTSGVFTWGTNQARVSNVQNLASNLNVYDGGNFTDSNGVFSATLFNGNGGGLTNVSTSYFTNIVNGNTNVNKTQDTMTWYIPVVVSAPAGTLGSAEIDAQIQRADGVWVTVSDCDIAGGVTSIIATNKETLVIPVPSGASMRVTNSTSGTGYIAGLDSTKTNMVDVH